MTDRATLTRLWTEHRAAELAWEASRTLTPETRKLRERRAEAKARRDVAIAETMAAQARAA